jgi:hypothetical protein
MTERAPRLVAVVALSTLLSCGKRQVHDEALPRPEPFIAFERDLQAFRDWERIQLVDRPAQGVTHEKGNAREYVNRRPAPGAKVFPVGTILVKEMSGGAEGDHIFAMVKRGGGYNARGAPGWEWFELKERKDESFAIVWRGINAPDGESYGGDPMGGCNDCHQLGAKNDYVRAEALSLSGPGS